MKKNILIVQFRTDKSLAHEQTCFRELFVQFPVELKFVSGLEEIQTHAWLDWADGIIFGGSGEFYVGKGMGETHWFPQVFSFIDDILARDIPLFAICFGFQIVSVHEGAEIVNEPALAEVGSVLMTPIIVPNDDPVFSHLTEPFFANVAHKETVMSLPSHLINFIRSEKVGLHAFRMQGKQVWGTLFHPELDRKHFIERYMLYLDNGVNDYEAAGVEKTIAQLKDTPEAQEILYRFVRYVVGSHLSP